MNVRNPPTTAGAVTEAALALHQFLASSLSVADTLDRIARSALTAIEPAAGIGVSLSDGRGGFTTAVATDRIAPVIDQAQYDDDQGPCLDCFRQNRMVVVDDLRRWKSTWPLFTMVAIAEGVASSLSLPLTYGEQALGAFNIYGTRRACFTTLEQQQGEVLATHAAVVIGNASTYWNAQSMAENLRIALTSRATIEQAKGMIMASRRCGPDEAFEMLVRASQRSNVRLRDLAQRIVDGASEGQPPRMDGSSIPTTASPGPPGARPRRGSAWNPEDPSTS